jgi:hypothetical protein
MQIAFVFWIWISTRYLFFSRWLLVQRKFLLEVSLPQALWMTSKSTSNSLVGWVKKNPSEFGCFVNVNPLNTQKATIVICLCEWNWLKSAFIQVSLHNPIQNQATRSFMWAIKITKSGEIFLKNHVNMKKKCHWDAFFVPTNIKIQRTIGCYSMYKKMTFLFHDLTSNNISLYLLIHIRIVSSGVPTGICNVHEVIGNSRRGY